MDQSQAIWKAMARAGWDDRETGDVGRECLRRLEICARVPKRGLWAVAAIRALTEEGARRKVKGFIDQEKQGYIGSAGTPIHMTASYAIPERDPQTKAKTGTFREVQLKLMTWAQIAEKRGAFERTVAKQQNILDILRLLEKLRRLHPTAETPFDAMILHGISPNKALINLSKLA